MIKYSVEELIEFKNKLISLRSSEEIQIQSFNGRLSEIIENGKDENSIDNTSYTMQIESLNDSINRSLKHLNSINNALLRIENGVYGICIETRKLIPKERLIAVPTTTLSIEGKQARESRK